MTPSRHHYSSFAAVVYLTLGPLFPALRFVSRYLLAKEGCSRC